MTPIIPLALALMTPPDPVVMSERTIGPESAITGGTTAIITVGDRSATLFIPNSEQRAKSKNLWMHFHTAPWFIVQEYQRADVKEPVLVFNLGQGSTVYAQPFQEPGALKPWLEATSKELGFAPEQLSVTSFSAGYGAVRNLVKDKEVVEKLKTVILADSLYASLSETEPARKVLAEHVDCWKPLQDRAIQGDCTWIVTTSQITPDSYAGTWEVASALVASTGGVMNDVAEGSCAAANGASQTLLRRFEKGRFWVWSYNGTDAMAHMTHPRHLAELIRVSQQP